MVSFDSKAKEVTYLQDHGGPENQHLCSLTYSIGPVMKTQGNSEKCRVQSKKGVLCSARIATRCDSEERAIYRMYKDPQSPVSLHSQQLPVLKSFSAEIDRVESLVNS